MDNKQIQQAAKEFCKTVSWGTSIDDTELREGYEHLLVSFLQSMIEKGEVVTIEEYEVCDRLRGDYYRQIKKTDSTPESAISEFDKYEWTEEHGTFEAIRCAFIDGFDLGKKSNFSSPGKGVKTLQEIEEYIAIRHDFESWEHLKSICKSDNMHYYDNLATELFEYQFKATPAKVISEEDAEIEAIRLSKTSQILSSHRFDKFSVLHGAMSMYKWYREQSNQQS